MTTETYNRTWAEINIKNLKYNYQNIKRIIPKETKVCCVVKANAYGHGAKQVAKCLQDEGADWFAVSNFAEALELRESGIDRPILILGYTPCKFAHLLAKNKISQCVFSLEYAKKLSEYAKRYKSTINIHIKIDTGMGRIGFSGSAEKQSTIDEIFEACNLDNLYPEGIFTHFSQADNGNQGKEFTIQQFNRFTKVIDMLKAKGIEFNIKHCSNSAAIIDYPEFSLDMVRPGIILYGLNPSDSLINSISLLPVMKLKTIISYIKEVDVNTPISYGSEYVTTKKQRIATLPIGYADGLWRSHFKNQSKLLINKRLASITGRICMDQTMIDITDIDTAKEEDEVVIFGDDEGLVNANKLAKNNGSIGYEMLCSVSSRVPRIYKNE